MIDKKFGKILKQLRHERNLSQEKLGFEAQLHRTYISQLERGVKSPSLHTLHKLSRALSRKMTELIALVEEDLDDN